MTTHVHSLSVYGATTLQENIPYGSGLVRTYTIWFRVGVLVMLLQFNSIFEFVVVYMVPFSLQTCALYWPEEYGYTVEYGPLSIELLFSSEADTNITVRTFKLTHRLKVWTSTQLY